MFVDPTLAAPAPCPAPLVILTTNTAGATSSTYSLCGWRPARFMKQVSES
jgi:hypothetical protein